MPLFESMSNIRAVFNAAMDEYNDEDKGELVIKHYPFRGYKIKPLPETKKRNLSVKEIRRIQAISDSQLTDRGKLDRDIFLLSFMLIGINAVDLYEMSSWTIKDGRITYNRQKTSDRRSDHAEFQLKLNRKLRVYLRSIGGEKERAFRFHELYTLQAVFSIQISIRG